MNKHELECHCNPSMRNSKNFLKYVWPLFNIMHERNNVDGLPLPVSANSQIKVLRKRVGDLYISILVYWKGVVNFIVCSVNKNLFFFQIFSRNISLSILQSKNVIGKLINNSVTFFENCFFFSNIFSFADDAFCKFIWNSFRNMRICCLFAMENIYVFVYLYIKIIFPRLGVRRISLFNFPKVVKNNMVRNEENWRN